MNSPPANKAKLTALLLSRLAPSVQVPSLRYFHSINLIRTSLPVEWSARPPAPAQCLLDSRRHLTGTVSRRTKETLPDQEQSDTSSKSTKTISKWRLILFLLGGMGAGTLLVDWRLRPIAMEVLRGAWDHDWDAEWNPIARESANTKDPGTYSGLLERLQSSTPSRNSSIVAPTPFRSTKQVILVRHGQYKNVGSEDDDEQGLTGLGQEQADLAGKRLAEILKDKKVRAIFHSDMKRARETAQRIAKFLPDVPLKEDAALAEGVPEFPEPPSATFKPTNLEVEVGRGRIDAAFKKYFFRPPSPKSPPSYDDEYDVYDVVVCHGNVIRYMFCRALQFPTSAWLRLATFNCGLTWLSVDNRGYVSAREFGNVGFIPTSKVTYY